MMGVMIEISGDGCHDRYPSIQYTLEVRGEEECRDSRTRSTSCTDCYLSEEREQNNTRDSMVDCAVMRDVCDIELS